MEVIRGILSELHKNFKNQVITSRGDRINPKDEDLFSGKVWIGQQAVDNGLVDGLSSIPRYIEVKLINTHLYSDIRTYFELEGLKLIEDFGGPS